MFSTHDGVCEDCGRKTPCLESYCREPNGHDYVCPDCLRKLRDCPDQLDLALSDEP